MHFQCLAFGQIDHNLHDSPLSIILSTIKPKSLMIKTVNFGN